MNMAGTSSFIAEQGSPAERPAAALAANG